MKAFLLAAGRGTRISRMIEEVPKCTLPLGDTPLIRYTARMLLDAGFELVVCVGYKKEAIFDALKGLPVTYYFNPFYEITNSIASLWFARSEIGPDMIVMNADVYITRNILMALMEDRHDVVMMIDRTRVKDGDYFFATTDNGCIMKYGKDLPIQMRSCEYVGLAKISHTFTGEFSRRLDELVGSSQYTLWWENVLYSFAGSRDIHTLDVEGEFWAEIDFFDDYTRILNHIKKEVESVSGRIYSKRTDIRAEDICCFYDRRANALENMENPYMAVLLGDQDPDHALKWNEFEKRDILPQMDIDQKSSVLDIGCGIGRWAEQVAPLCGKYVGTDLSPEMVKAASRRIDRPNCSFLNLSFQETVCHAFPVKFNRVFICGVCMYINDAELERCFKGLLSLLDEHCVLYLTETVAAETRLTLDNLPSEALKADYSAIYRTPDEYRTYYKSLEAAGFRVARQEYLPHLNNEKGFDETDRWYSIFKR